MSRSKAEQHLFQRRVEVNLKRLTAEDIKKVNVSLEKPSLSSKLNQPSTCQSSTKSKKKKLFTSRMSAHRI